MMWLDAALKISETISRLAIWMSGLGILAVTVVISVEVLLRKLFNVSTGGADELSGYALAICFSWALGFTALRRAHVRIDALYCRLPIATRPYLDCLGILSLTLFSIVLAYFCFQVLLDTIELRARSNTTLGTPLWIPQTLWIAGLFLFSWTCVLLSVSSICALIRGDHARVRLLVGSRTAEEEIAAEAPASSFPPKGP